MPNLPAQKHQEQQDHNSSGIDLYPSFFCVTRFLLLILSLREVGGAPTGWNARIFASAAMSAHENRKAPWGREGLWPAPCWHSPS